MYRHHTFEEKLSIVSLLINGYSLGSLCRERHLDKHMVCDWFQRYQLYGKEGIRKGTAARHMQPKEKELLVRDFLEKGVTLQKLCLHYNVSRTAAKLWIRLTRQRGYIALYESKLKGKQCKDMSRRKKKEPQTELEKLQAENLRLRAENALLKKVKALVKEQNARARLNGQKPSTN